MNITLDNVLMILDEHYNNVKGLDALNKELFQLHMADKETFRFGSLPIQTSPGFGQTVSMELQKSLWYVSQGP